MIVAKFVIVSFVSFATLSPFALAQGESSRSIGSQAPSTSSTSESHASTGAAAGSHEDWCAEHEVPESQCTRCNKELIPAFKASNDWCAEHGLPESQCRACNPKLEIKRPPGGK